MDNSQFQRKDGLKSSHLFRDLLYSTNNEAEKSCKWRIFNSNCPADKLSKDEIQFRKLGEVFKKGCRSKKPNNQLKTLDVDQALDKDEFQTSLNSNNQTCLDWDKFLDEWEGISENSGSSSKGQALKHKKTEKLQACLSNNSVSIDLKEKEITRNSPSSALSIEQITKRNQTENLQPIQNLKSSEQSKTTENLQACLPGNSLSIGTKESTTNSSSVPSIEQNRKRNLTDENLMKLPTKRMKLSSCGKEAKEYSSQQDLQSKTVDELQVCLPGNSVRTKEKRNTRNPPSVLPIERILKPDKIDESLEIKRLELWVGKLWLEKFLQEYYPKTHQQYKTAEKLQVCLPENSVSTNTQESTRNSSLSFPSLSFENLEPIKKLKLVLLKRWIKRNQEERASKQYLQSNRIEKPQVCLPGNSVCTVTKEKESTINPPSSVLPSAQIDESSKIKLLELLLCKKWLEKFQKEYQQRETAVKPHACLPENSASASTKENTRNSSLSVFPIKQITEQNQIDECLESKILKLFLCKNLLENVHNELDQKYNTAKKLRVSVPENSVSIDTKKSIKNFPSSVEQITEQDQIDERLKSVSQIKLMVDLYLEWFARVYKERDLAQKLAFSLFEKEMKMMVYPVSKDKHGDSDTSRLENLLANTQLKLFKQVELPPLIDELLSMDSENSPQEIENTFYSGMDLKSFIKLLEKAN